MKPKATINKEEVRRVVADLLGAAGCSCCRDDRRWEDAQARLARLLDVPPYSDGSGFDFAPFRTPTGDKT